MHEPGPVNERQLMDNSHTMNVAYGLNYIIKTMLNFLTLKLSWGYVREHLCSYEISTEVSQGKGHDICSLFSNSSENSIYNITCTDIYTHRER